MFVYTSASPDAHSFSFQKPKIWNMQLMNLMQANNIYFSNEKNSFESLLCGFVCGLIGRCRTNSDCMFFLRLAKRTRETASSRVTHSIFASLVDDNCHVNQCEPTRNKFELFDVSIKSLKRAQVDWLIEILQEVAFFFISLNLSLAYISTQLKAKKN